MAAPAASRAVGRCAGPGRRTRRNGAPPTCRRWPCQPASAPWKRSSGPGPCPGSSGRWDARGNRRRGGRSWPRSPQATACPVVRSTRTCLHWRVPRVPRGTVAKPLRAAPPHVQTGFRRGPVPRPLSCLPPLPFAVAQGVGGPAALCCLQPARRRTRRWTRWGRRSGAFEARRLHGGRLRRMLREARRDCARAARATTRRQQPERHARWHDERHGNVQRIGGRHGRVSSLTGCATPITADALTGPK